MSAKRSMNVPDAAATHPGNLAASVIVCTHDRAHLLNRVLEALCSQTMPPDRYEVIIVDDGSGEETRAACREWQARKPDLRVVRHDTCEGLPAARNSGAATASTNRLLFTDDDCVPDRDWIENLASCVANHPIVAGAIDSPPSPFWMYCHNLAQFYGFLSTVASGPMDWLTGANFAVQRETLERLGGFRKRYDFAEDTEFILRARQAGLRAWFHPAARVLHVPERTSLPAIVRYAAAHAVSTSRLRLDYADVLNTPRVLKSPVLLALAAPLCAGWITWRAARAARFRAHALAAAPFVFITKLAWCAGAIDGINRYRKANAT